MGLHWSSGFQSSGERPDTIASWKGLILSATELSPPKSLGFPPHPQTFKPFLVSVFPFEPLGHQLSPSYKSYFCLQFYPSGLAHLPSLYFLAALVYS